MPMMTYPVESAQARRHVDDGGGVGDGGEIGPWMMWWMKVTV
jgi:hypothetical protein